MDAIAFRMVLKPGQAEEYKRRHDEIWPELSALLKRVGASDYSIWLDEETHHLFATLKRSDGHRMDSLVTDPIVRKWWDYMADIMEVHADNAPVQVTLTKMFHLL